MFVVIASKHSVESRKGVLILGPIQSAWRGTEKDSRALPVGWIGERFYEPTRHSAQSQTTELANFDDDQGHIVGEGAMPPGSHAVEDRSPHFRQWKLCGIED